MRYAILISGCLLAVPASAAESDRLRELMGETVYRQSGIESLSQEQLEVLEQWILGEADRPRIDHRPPAAPERETDGTAEAPAPVASTQAGPQAPSRSGARHDEDDEPEIVRSRIDGHFEGWRNNGTVFRLQNGQIWEQRQPATFITDLTSPEVIIRRNRFGHTMEVPAIDRKVHVRRIR